MVAAARRSSEQACRVSPPCSVRRIRWCALSMSGTGHGTGSTMSRWLPSGSTRGNLIAGAGAPAAAPATAASYGRPY